MEKFEARASIQPLFKGVLCRTVQILKRHRDTRPALSQRRIVLRSTPSDAAMPAIEKPAERS